MVLGRRESSFDLSELTRDGFFLLVSTAQGSVGTQSSALLGSALVSGLVPALTASLPFDPGGFPPVGPRCLLFCEDFQSLTGVDWDPFLSGREARGLSVVLSTQSLRGFRSPGSLRGLWVIAGY